MKRIAAAFLLLFAVAVTSGFWQSRDSNYNQNAYVGPGDINGTAFAFWSTRCITAAYTGNLMDVTDSATGNTTGTRLQCSAGGVISSLVSSSACTFVTGNACSDIATTCATACNVMTFYDQSGSTNCSGACDATQTTNASRPPLTLNSQNGKMVVGGGVSSLPTAVLSAAQAQALSATLVAKRTSNTTLQRNGTGGANAALRFGFTSSANTAFLTTDGDGTDLTATANDNVYHAMQALLNGASSKLYIDGSLTTGDAGTGGITTGAGEILGMGGCPCNNLMGSGFVLEAGWWAGDKSANNALMNQNQRVYWNF